MAVLLWSVSDSLPIDMLLRTGPMRGPMATSGPPNHDDQPAGSGTSVVDARRCLSSGAARSGESWCDIVPEVLSFESRAAPSRPDLQPSYEYMLGGMNNGSQDSLSKGTKVQTMQALEVPVGQNASSPCRIKITPSR
jgi:hypothetical protein